MCGLSSLHCTSALIIKEKYTMTKSKGLSILKINIKYLSLWYQCWSSFDDKTRFACVKDMLTCCLHAGMFCFVFWNLGAMKPWLV